MSLKSYNSPSTPEYNHTEINYLAEILLIKKHPEAINVFYPWNNDKYASDYIVFKSMASTLCKHFPVHLITDILVYIDINNFEPSYMIGYIEKKISQ